MPTALGTIASHRTAVTPAGNPFTMVAWHAAYWASDPLWTPPADGGVVTTWRDGSGNNRTMTTSGGPIYRAASSVLNNKPAVEFDGIDAQANTSDFTPLVAPPYSWVAILRNGNPVVQGYWASGTNSAGAYIDTNAYGMYGGVVLSGGTANTSRHLVVAGWDSVSKIEVDGTQVASGNSGSPSQPAWRIAVWANGTSAPGQNTYGFVGFKAGALTAQEKADLLAWSRSFYGTP